MWFLRLHLMHINKRKADDQYAINNRTSYKARKHTRIWKISKEK